jgi:hypothetical protein
MPLPALRNPVALMAQKNLRALGLDREAVLDLYGGHTPPFKIETFVPNGSSAHAG